MLSRSLLAAALAALTVGAAACGGDGDTSKTTAAAQGAGACTKADLAVRTPGRLTVATDKPAYPPYFVDGKPENGKGFESAVAYAIAEELGFSPAEVTWVTVPFNASYAPGPKTFDFDVNQISITPARAKRVDFSSPYYTAPQAIVALDESPAASARSLAELQEATLGVQVGTTSLDAAIEVIKPSRGPQVFDDSDDTVKALKLGRVDAVVVDLPTAFYLTAAEVEGSRIVGQFAAPGGDSWGALLEKGSKLTACVDRAIRRLRDNGTLKALEAQWLGEAAGAPSLR